MAEYVNRETAIKELLNDAPEQVGYSREDAADCIQYMDAADVAQVRHGRWVHICKAIVDTTGDCSACYKEAVWRTRNNPYGICPNCGAKMDGGNDD